MDKIRSTASKFSQVCITPTNVMIASVLSLALWIITVVNYYSVKALIPEDKSKRNANQQAAVRTSWIVLAISTIALCAAGWNAYQVLQ
jgi:hypothetical protein